MVPLTPWRWLLSKINFSKINNCNLKLLCFIQFLLFDDFLFSRLLLSISKEKTIKKVFTKILQCEFIIFNIFFNKNWESFAYLPPVEQLPMKITKIESWFMTFQIFEYNRNKLIKSCCCSFTSTYKRLFLKA